MEFWQFLLEKNNRKFFDGTHNFDVYCLPEANGGISTWLNPSAVLICIVDPAPNAGSSKSTFSSATCTNCRSKQFGCWTHPLTFIGVRVIKITLKPEKNICMTVKKVYMLIYIRNGLYWYIVTYLLGEENLHEASKLQPSMTIQFRVELLIDWVLENILIWNCKEIWYRYVVFT